MRPHLVRVVPAEHHRRRVVRRHRERHGLCPPRCCVVDLRQIERERRGGLDLRTVDASTNDSAPFASKVNRLNVVNDTASRETSGVFYDPDAKSTPISNGSCWWRAASR